MKAKAAFYFLILCPQLLSLERYRRKKRVEESSIAELFTVTPAGYAVLVEKAGHFLEKAGHFRKMPGFFSIGQVLVV
jgi:hypothetical protein